MAKAKHCIGQKSWRQNKTKTRKTKPWKTKETESGFRTVPGIQVMPLESPEGQQEMKKPGIRCFDADGNEMVLKKAYLPTSGEVVMIPVKDVKNDGRGNHKEVYR